MDTELKNINLKRGLMLQDMALIEMVMNRFISKFYLKEESKQFISEVLQHTYFSFELRKQIFQSIFLKKFPNYKFPEKALNKMQKLRNIAAHARLDEDVLKDENGKRKERFGHPFYSYHTDTKDALTLHSEFDSNMAEVVEALNKIKEETNIIFNSAPPVEI